jgi:hypothetical protein
VGRWGTLGKLQLMLRKASQALYANEEFNLEEMHNYRMAVTEREVINGCLNVDNVSSANPLRSLLYIVCLFKGGNLHTSTEPLSMRYTTMRYTSMRHTSLALYFYEEFTQAPDKNFKKHFKQKICI